MDVEIREDVLRVFNRMQEVVRRKTPLLRIVGETVLSSVQKNFLEEGRPEPWVPLAQSTVMQREKLGYTPINILRRTADLFRSLHYEVEGDSVNIGVGAEIEYAAIQHFGGYAGRGHRAHIPARPYLLIQEEDWEEMERGFYKLLDAVWRGRVNL